MDALEALQHVLTLYGYTYAYLHLMPAYGQIDALKAIRLSFYDPPISIDPDCLQLVSLSINLSFIFILFILILFIYILYIIYT
jgi:hypothetical protein